MKIIKDGKLFGKISIIDILVVVILIFVVIGIIAKYTQVTSGDVGQNNASDIVFEYDIKYEYIRPTTGQILRVGDKIFDKVSGTNIGEITNVLVENAKLNLGQLDGSIYQKEVSGKADITVTVKTTGSIKNNEYMANNLIRILLGKTIETKTKYVDVTGTIIDIRDIEE